VCHELLAPFLVIFSVLYLRILVVEGLSTSVDDERECEAKCHGYFRNAEKALKAAEGCWEDQGTLDIPLTVEATYNVQAMFNASLAFRWADKWGCKKQKDTARKLFELAHENYNECHRRGPESIDKRLDELVERVAVVMNEGQ
jgi:hypothetical protein